ncbi:hypothetical protein CcI6DRAFT_03980 [Frankia sp. CcI6]|nr:hypothetical protein CcI6DRAFT_03980 [Frankia sp. CcI6]KFB03100.1 hypothetical protein ALLO2DRAFT_04139 [Frankia sp. Allo2]
MTGGGDVSTIHQLLGRIVYFHALFIEPALPVASVDPSLGSPCCNHHSALSRRPTVERLLASTAWAAIAEVAATIPAFRRDCPGQGSDCCATCCVRGSAEAVAACWVETEYHAYHHVQPGEAIVRACQRAAADRLGRVFAAQHHVSCRVMAEIETRADRLTLPSADELPLIGELLALWDDLSATAQRPVVGWLNHCAGLDDVRRVLLRTGSQS